MKKDTNAQEGLGGYLQMLATASKEGLFHGLTTCSGFLDRYDNIWTMAKSGIFHKYKRTTKKQKNKADEKQSDYKAPDSAARVFNLCNDRKKEAHSSNIKAKKHGKRNRDDPASSPLVQMIRRKSSTRLYFGNTISTNFEDQFEQTQLASLRNDGFNILPFLRECCFDESNKRGIINQNPSERQAVNRCFISASIPVFARTNILSILKSIPQSSRSSLIQSIVDISTQYNAMSSTPIDASALFLNATKSFPQLATGQGDLHEFVSECLVSIRRALRPHHRSINSEMIDAITPMFVTSKSQTRSSDLTMHEATERSVIELGLPDEQDDAGNALQIVALQDLVDKAFAPQVDEDISKKIDGFMWSQQLPSTGIAIFQINRTHYVDNYYNRTKVNIPLSVIINDVEYFLLCASLRHGGLEGGHFTRLSA